MKSKLILTLAFSILTANAFAADGFDRTNAHNFGYAPAHSAAVAADGFDRTPAGKVAEDRFDRTPAGKVAADGFDRTPAGRIS